MNDKITHLVGRAQSGLEILELPANLSIWKNQKPLRFTEVTAELRDLLQ